MRAIYWLLTRFGWFWGLVSGILGLVRDIGTVAIVFKLFGVNLNPLWYAVSGTGIFFFGVAGGEWLKRKGYLHYSTNLGNSINPWDNKLDEILKKLEK